MDTEFEVPYPLRAAVFGLQAFTMVALVTVSLAVLVAMFWKNALLQNFVQLVAKVLPIEFILTSARFQRTMINAKIDTEHCAICYCDIDKEVKSNCGHVFCGDCLIKVWYSKKHEKIACPLCRCDVNVIVPSFALQQQPDQDDSHEEIIHNINKYNISCSNCPTTILGLILGSPSAMKFFLESLPGRKGFTKAVKVFLGFIYSLAMLVYLVSPSEMVQDDSMFGLVDESASFIYLFLYVILIFIFMS